MGYPKTPHHTRSPEFVECREPALHFASGDVTSWWSSRVRRWCRLGLLVVGLLVLGHPLDVGLDDGMEADLPHRGHSADVLDDELLGVAILLPALFILLVELRLGDDIIDRFERAALLGIEPPVS
jgi:hypothetical protein